MELNYVNFLTNKTIILRGTGIEAEEFINNWNCISSVYFKLTNIQFPKIKYVTDNNLLKQGKNFYDYIISNPDAVASPNNNIFIIIAIAKYNGIYNELIQKGYKHLSDFDYWKNIITKIYLEMAQDIKKILINLSDNNRIDINKTYIEQTFEPQNNSNDILMTADVYRKISESDLKNNEKSLIRDLIIINNLKKYTKLNYDVISKMVEYFPANEVIAALAKIFYDDIDKIEPDCNNGSSFISKTKKIKTIGIYNIKFSNGGTERVISLLIPIFISMGYNIVLFTNQKEDNEYYIPANVKRVILKYFKCFDADFKIQLDNLLNNIIKYNIDIMFYHNLKDVTLFYEALFLKLSKIPVTCELHNTFTCWIKKENPLAKYLKDILPLMNKVVVLSETDKKYWEKFNSNVEYIPNPIENGYEFWNKPIAFKKRNGKKLLWIGRPDSSIKRFSDIIEIIKKITSEIPDIFLKVVGNTEEISDDIYQIIKNYGLKDNIEFCGYHSDVTKFYEEADIMLMTSEYEGFPMVLVESKLHGVPTVMYELPYLALVQDKRGVVEVSQQDMNASANAVIKILKDNKLRHKISIEAKQSLYPFITYDYKKAWSDIFNLN